MKLQVTGYGDCFLECNKTSQQTTNKTLQLWGHSFPFSFCLVGMQLLTFQQGLPKLRVSHGTSGSGSNVVTLFEQIELSKYASVFSLSLPREILRTQIDCEISGLLRCCAAAVIEIIDYEEPVPPEDEIPDSDDQVPVHGTRNACLI